MEGAEDGVGLARLGAQLVEVVHRVKSRMGEALDTCLPERARHAIDPPSCEGTGVGAEVRLAGLGLPGERGQLAFGLSAADDEEAAEALVEVREALEHELGPRAGGVAPGEEAVVEAEHGHDAVGTVEGGAQSGMVVDAKVAREPDEGGHAGGTG